jgi:hypothetical protein
LQRAGAGIAHKSPHFKKPPEGGFFMALSNCLELCGKQPLSGETMLMSNGGGMRFCCIFIRSEKVRGFPYMLTWYYFIDNYSGDKRALD